jgi:alpha-L-fucosidase 2
LKEGYGGPTEEAIALYLPQYYTRLTAETDTKSGFQPVMKHGLTAVVLPALAASLLLSCRQPQELAPNPTRANITWSSPSTNAMGSMPLGNGDIGANVWVEPSGDLVLLLSKTDAFDEFNRLLKLGRLRIRTNPALDTRHFSQTLHLESGTIEIRAGNVHVRIWIDAHHPVAQVDLDSPEPVQVEVYNEVWRKEARALDRVAGSESERHSAYGNRPDKQRVNADVVFRYKPDQIAWCHHNLESQWEANLRHTDLEPGMAGTADPVLHRSFGALVRGSGMQAVSDTTLISVNPQRTAAIRIFALTAISDTPEHWLRSVGELTNHHDDPAEIRYARHCDWWRQFWRRSWIEIDSSGPDTAEVRRVSDAYALQRFLAACAGRGALPIKFNGSIFTVNELFDPDYRRWGGPYWFQNTRMPYWAMLYSGDYDLMEPFFRMYADALPLRRAATRRYFGHDGAFYPETMHFWGNYADENYGFQRDDLPAGITENQYIRRHWEGALELLVIMLDYHDGTQDSLFLRHTLIPMAREITAAYDQHWARGPDGMVLYHPAQSLETWWDCTDPTPPIAGLRYLLPRLLDLPVDAAQREAWQRQLADQPEIPTVSEGGVVRILPAREFDLLMNVENPELYPVFPFRLFTLAGSDSGRRIAINTWQRRRNTDNIGWQQQPIQAAMLGLTDEAWQFVQERAMEPAKGYRFPGFYGPHYDWTPCQDHISVQMVALQRMLMQCEGDRILLLPAWPAGRDVRFKLHAPDRTIVEGEVKGGALVRLEVHPQARQSDIEILGPMP